LVFENPGLASRLASTVESAGLLPVAQLLDLHVDCERKSGWLLLIATVLDPQVDQRVLAHLAQASGDAAARAAVTPDSREHS